MWRDVFTEPARCLPGGQHRRPPPRRRRRTGSRAGPGLLAKRRCRPRGPGGQGRGRRLRGTCPAVPSGEGTRRPLARDEPRGKPRSRRATARLLRSRPSRQGSDSIDSGAVARTMRRCSGEPAARHRHATRRSLIPLRTGRWPVAVVMTAVVSSCSSPGAARRRAPAVRSAAYDVDHPLGCGHRYHGGDRRRRCTTGVRGPHGDGQGPRNGPGRRTGY